MVKWYIHIVKYFAAVTQVGIVCVKLKRSLQCITFWGDRGLHLQNVEVLGPGIKPKLQHNQSLSSDNVRSLTR